LFIEEKYRTIMGDKGVIELLIELLVKPSSTTLTKARIAGAMWNLIWNSNICQINYLFDMTLLIPSM
jgi:hypothetical protein